jgi:hypothetical protein
MIELRQRRGPRPAFFRAGWLRAGWLLLAGVELLANPAQAFTSSSIEWEAPEACPSASALSERLNVLLGEDARLLGGGAHVRGVVSKDASGYRVVLEVAEAQRRSSREFSSDNCADLTEAAALAIALAVHAEERAAAAAPIESPTLGTEVVPPPGDVGAPAPEGLQAKVRWSAGAEGVLDTGALPAVAPGVSILGRAQLARWSVDVHGSLLPMQRLDVGSDQVEFGLQLLGLRACDWFVERSTRVAVCAAFEAGRLSASGGTLSPPRQLDDVWLAPGVALEAGQHLGSGWQLLVRGEALAPLLRKQYIVNENARVHAPSSVDLRFSLGLLVGTD